MFAVVFFLICWSTKPSLATSSSDLSLKESSRFWELTSEIEFCVANDEDGWNISKIKQESTLHNIGPKFLQLKFTFSLLNWLLKTLKCFSLLLSIFLEIFFFCRVVCYWYFVHTSWRDFRLYLFTKTILGISSSFWLLDLLSTTAFFCYNSKDML